MEFFLERNLRTADSEQYFRVTKNKPTVLIGRSLKSDFRLHSTYISRNHAEITLRDGKLCVKDNTSTFGIYINDQKIDKEKFFILKLGDFVEFGKPPQNDKIWSTITYDDRFIYTVKEEISELLNQREPCAKQQHSAIFKRTRSNSSNISLNKTKQPAEAVLDKYVTVPICDINLKKYKPAKIPINNFSSKVLQISLNKSDVSKNVIVEQENKRLKMELAKKDNEICDRDDKIEGLKNSNTKTVEKLVDALESELQCMICNEIFIRATTLNCTHTFCQLCILQWKKRKNECPVCREKISTTTHTLFVDNYIERVLVGLDKKLQDERKVLMDERKNAMEQFLEQNKPKVVVNTRQGRGGRRRRRRPNVTRTINTGIPIIRVQSIDLTAPDTNNSATTTVTIDSQSSTQMEQADINNGNNGVIIIS